MDAGYVTQCQLNEAIVFQKTQNDVLIGQALVQLGALDQYRLDMMLLRQRYVRDGDAHAVADLAKRHSLDLTGSFAGLVEKLK